eukprot:527283-Prymnesium_polylepis.1
MEAARKVHASRADGFRTVFSIQLSVFRRTCCGCPEREPTRSKRMPRPGKKRTEYARSRSVDGRRACVLA